MKYIILLILFLPSIGYSQGFPKKDTLDGTEKLFLFAEPSGNKYVTTQNIADLATGSEAVTGFADAAFLNNDASTGYTLRSLTDTTTVPAAIVYSNRAYKAGTQVDTDFGLNPGHWYLTSTGLDTVVVENKNILALIVSGGKSSVILNERVDRGNLVEYNLSDTTTIASKYNGMLVYFEDVGQYWSYNGSFWAELETGGDVISRLSISGDNLLFNDEKIKSLKSKSKWAVFGDSFSNSTTGDYLKEVIEIIDLEVSNVSTNAVSGHTINSQLTVLDTLLANNSSYFDDKDIVSLLIGANDYAFNTPIGSAADTVSQPTFAGRLKYFIETVLDANPKTKLYLITPTKATSGAVFYETPNTAGWFLSNLAELISEIGVRYSVPVIDLYSTANFNNNTIDSLTLDGLHPSQNGRNIIANIVASAFNSGYSTGQRSSASNITQYWVESSGKLVHSALPIEIENSFSLLQPNFLAFKINAGATEFPSFNWHSSGGIELSNSVNIANTEPLFKVSNYLNDSRFSVQENGQLKADGYGSRTFSGTIASLPAFTSTGDIVETPPLLGFNGGSISAGSKLSEFLFYSSDPSGVASGIRASIYAENSSGGAWNGNAAFEDVDIVFETADNRVVSEAARLTKDKSLIVQNTIIQKTITEYASSTKIAAWGGVNNDILGFRDVTFETYITLQHSNDDTDISETRSVYSFVVPASMDGKSITEVSFLTETLVLNNAINVGLNRLSISGTSTDTYGLTLAVGSRDVAQTGSFVINTNDKIRIDVPDIAGTAEADGLTATIIIQ